MATSAPLRVSNHEAKTGGNESTGLEKRLKAGHDTHECAQVFQGCAPALLNPLFAPITSFGGVDAAPEGAASFSAAACLTGGVAGAVDYAFGPIRPTG